LKGVSAASSLAEALRAYQRLRILLREELGIAPSPAVQAVHRRLLLHSADR
jgi:DNA-binding SARP family transcriptional activator